MKNANISNRPKLRVVYVVINDHCNLNCAGCDGFAALANRMFYSLNEIAEWMEQLDELLEVENVRIMGGEPTLHPDLPSILFRTRQIFEKAKIELITNGIRTDMIDCSFPVLQECNIGLCLSDYGQYDKRQLRGLRTDCKEFGIKFKLFPGGKSFNKTFSLEKHSQPLQAMKLCRSKKDWFCPVLRSGRLFHCSKAAFIPIFNNYFCKNLPTQFGADIMSKDISGEGIIKYLNMPVKLCYYCRPDKYEPIPNWKVSKKEISEWVIEK